MHEKLKIQSFQYQCSCFRLIFFIAYRPTDTLYPSHMIFLTSLQNMAIENINATSIFSFSNNVFYPSRDKTIILATLKLLPASAFNLVMIDRLIV